MPKVRVRSFPPGIISHLRWYWASQIRQRVGVRDCEARQGRPACGMAQRASGGIPERFLLKKPREEGRLRVFSRRYAAPDGVRSTSFAFTHGLEAVKIRCRWLLRLRRLMCGKPVAFRQAAQPKSLSVEPSGRKGRAFPHIRRQSRDFLPPSCAVGSRMRDRPLRASRDKSRSGNQ